MKRMIGIVILGLALTLPTAAVSPQPSATIATASSSQAQGCAADGNSHVSTVNPEYLWRLRAYEDLDCALVILDDALKTQGNVITLSRHEAERARARVWSARDAAARIGR